MTGDLKSYFNSIYNTSFTGFGYIEYSIVSISLSTLGQLLIVTDLLRYAELAQLFCALTLTLPVVAFAPADIRILNVFCPEVIVEPDGTVQLYADALATEIVEKDTLACDVHKVAGPVIEAGVAGRA